MPGFRGATEIHYPSEHARTRARAFAALPEYSPCARCGHPMWKHQQHTTRTGRVVSALHWDHNHTRTGYLGFSHGSVPCHICGQRCNVKAGAAQGARVANARRKQHHMRRTRRTDLPGW